MATVVVLTVVVLIQVFYEALCEPEPNRFGFWTNFLYDGILITVHLVAATGIMRFARVLRSGTPRSSNG